MSDNIDEKPQNLKATILRFLGLAAIFLPAFDTVFNLGIWLVHSVMTGLKSGSGHVVFYQEQGWFLYIYFFCVIGGFIAWVCAFSCGVRRKLGWTLAMILTATISFVWQFVVTFAMFQ
ncbi:hypothetical protein DS901_04120 [Loktanella sp. D2R18]|uniref:hypothetical protein n=1 Tax=Rhodobacterales TaxID=204455 RepID=UPI000DE929B7|nr:MULTISPECIES: hypothetical protein [Rhodobacterales]MDO6589156.1 hypothetical protein [Yoonia sp. 1_MG-2023]RBW45414.1 hypothetical protein DS901_04120 [Loktanella sp. D2R18]